jgi:hypothetical protein
MQQSLKYYSLKRLYPFLFLFFIFSNYDLYSQDESNKIDYSTKDSLNRVYGLDPLLYNGMLFNSFYPGKVKGDQYFINSNFIKGEVLLRGIKYKNLELNYDLNKQELIFKYLNSSNVFSIIMISKAWLESFTLGSYRFKVYSTPEAPNRFYQVLGNESIELLYYWNKVIAFETDYLENTSLYFETFKEQNLFINKTLYKFDDNKSFVKLFAKEKQETISKYLRHNKIKVQKASDQTMEQLINFCSKL